MSRVVIIGGGAAGMMAAIACASGPGHETVLLEQNEKLGKKLFLTGKGRCNLTNACELDELFAKVIRNPKFLYSSIYQYDNRQVMEFFEKQGVPLKTERGARVFPESDHSSDIIKALEKAMRAAGVTIRLNTKVRGLSMGNGRVDGVVLFDGKTLQADYIVVATGGLSYPSTGSAGDGFTFAKKAGHHIMECFPSLVPLKAKEPYVKELMGLSLKNAMVRFIDGKKTLYEDMGEMMFTHFGVTGPLILSASSILNERLRGGSCAMEIDFKPALDEKKLDRRILRDWEENKNRQYKNSLGKLLPSRLIPVVIQLSGIDAEKKVHEITKEERRRLLQALKHFPLTITGFCGYEEAVVTRGGVSVKEVRPDTMESKIMKGLYFAGEILDVDALTGGFNLQIAWSTGFQAGDSIKRKAGE